MLDLDHKTDLQKHLAASGANAVTELTARDYRRAFALWCTERKRHGAGLRHASTIDFDHAAMRPVFALAARLKDAQLGGRLADVPQLEHEIAAAVLAVIDDCVRVRCANEFRTLAFEREAAAQGTDNWLLWDDAHGADYRAETLAERATAIEAGRDFVEELAVRA